MKILMLLKYPLVGSGSGTYTFKLAEKLAKLYPQDQVAVFCPDSRNRIPNVKMFYFDMPFKSVATGHPDWPKAKLYSNLNNQEIDKLFFSAFRQVLNVINIFKPDVIHVHHAFYFSWIANYLR